jgi:uncharacterized protein with GYD domain
MRFYMSGAYTPEALRSMQKTPSNRREAAEKVVTAAGGKMISFDRTLSEGPGFLVIFEADAVSAAAINIVVSAGGAVANVKFGRLWSDEELPAIRKKRGEIESSYKAP